MIARNISNNNKKVNLHDSPAEQISEKTLNLIHAWKLQIYGSQKSKYGEVFHISKQRVDQILDAWSSNPMDKKYGKI